MLGLPIRAAALAAAQVASDGQVIAVSGTRRLAIAAADLLESPLSDLSRRFSGRDAWAAYVLGPVALLVREERLPLAGLRLVLSSSVPEGKGLGSSAAVEVAAALASCGAFGWPLEPRRVALLGQRAEQVLAGAPCGVMDQMTAAHGEAARLLALLCQSCRGGRLIRAPVRRCHLGDRLGSTARRPGAPYRRARCASFMGKALLEIDVEHLTTLRPRELEAERLPERMRGAEFLRLRDGIDDEMSSIEPEVEYPVRAATLHPIAEQEQVETFLGCSKNRSVCRPPAISASSWLPRTTATRAAGWGRR